MQVMIKLYNQDCMEALKLMKDNQFDLACVDPPYGIGEDGGRFRDRKGGGHRVLAKRNWDSSTPELAYFVELQRVSRSQIIWGGNYFTDKLSASRCWIYWDKLMGGDFSDGELAWTSFDKVLKKFTLCNKMGGKIHPTQKPVKLYEWLLQNYAKEGDTILDTHLGSGSIALACHNLGFDLTGYEIDKDYFDAAKARLEEHQKQQKLF
jgi:site-specific DNA-methyltransferase (adenine-specific)